MSLSINVVDVYSLDDCKTTLRNYISTYIGQVLLVSCQFEILLFLGMSMETNCNQPNVEEYAVPHAEKDAEKVYTQVTLGPVARAKDQMVPSSMLMNRHYVCRPPTTLLTRRKKRLVPPGFSC